MTTREGFTVDDMRELAWMAQRLSDGREFAEAVIRAACDADRYTKEQR